MSHPDDVGVPLVAGAGRADAALRRIAHEALMLRNFLRQLDAYGDDRDSLDSGLWYAARAAAVIGWLADRHLSDTDATGETLEDWLAPELAKLGPAPAAQPQA